MSWDNDPMGFCDDLSREDQHNMRESWRTVSGYYNDPQNERDDEGEDMGGDEDDCNTDPGYDGILGEG